MDLRRAPLILLDDQSGNPGEASARLYTDPVKIICARSVDDVLKALEDADKALADGYHLAGWIAYEAAAAFEPHMKEAIQHLPEEELIWFGVFAAPRLLSSHDLESLLNDNMGGIDRRARITARHFKEDAKTHSLKLDRIKQALAAGEVYQINHTFPVDLDVKGDPLNLYRRLRRAQPVAYGAYIDTGKRRVLSFSPELFIRSAGGELEARPMKGTAPRGLDKNEDDIAAKDLRTDEKSRAENLMITDLLRNDLSRIASPGSVTTPDLFTVERFKTVLQMTSTVRAKRDESKDFSHLIRAIFPCGSITGAPKIRAMKLIGMLENNPRGLYTGAIGWAAPDGDLCFSVAIRTAVERADGRFRFGVGSGIVADSDNNAEYEECRLKTQFIEQDVCDFSLIETLAWHPDSGYAYMGRHLHRLHMSATYFDFPFDRTMVREVLQSATTLFHAPMSVRLLLSGTGQTSVTASRLCGWPEPVKLCLATDRLHSRDPYVRHKTTRRRHYEAPLRQAMELKDADEVVFINEHGALCEGARSTLFIEKNGILLTPSLDAGLLPGILRTHLIETGRAYEADLRPEDLTDASALYVGNSVRGLGRACLIEP